MFKRITHITIALFLALLLFQSCNQTDNSPAVENPLWSSTNPFTIPTKTRIQKHLSGNLVPNASFESGRWIDLDSSARFLIDGWKKVGDNVKWVDIGLDSVFNPDEVSDKKHAIKITREKTSETVIKGEGIISDFIKVIPGNYELLFDIRLENIKPYKSRLGNKIDDAIDVCVEFYDKSKNRISGDMYSTLLKTEINYSFKGYPFSNYDEIKYMPWVKIRGRSYEPPIMEGIIPNNAQYVKLLFSLKGTGTMWIDNIEYSYADNNLSLLERLEAYGDSLYSAYDLIIPKPKKLAPFDTLKIAERFLSDNHQPIVILLPEEQNEFLDKAVELLSNALDGMFDSISFTPDIIFTNDISNLEINEIPIVFSIGNTVIHNRYIEFFPYKEIKGYNEGYFVYTNPDLPNLVFIGGNSDISLFYAVSTYVQLFDKKYNRIFNPRIIDYPSFKTRGCVVEYIAEEDQVKLFDNLEKLSRYKMNHLLFDSETSILQKGETNFGVYNKLKSNQVSKYFTSTLLINPFLEKSMVKEDAEYNCYEVFKPLNLSPSYLYKYIKDKPEELIISFGSNYNLINNCIDNKIENWNVLEAIQNHKDIIEENTAYSNKVSPETKLSFIPIGLEDENYFRTEGQMQLYYQNIFEAIKNKNSSFIWSGKNTYCPVIDYADFYRFSNFYQEYPPIIYSDIQTDFLLDHESNQNWTIGNKRLYSLFSPCQLSYFEPVHRVNKEKSINFDLNIISSIDIIRFYSYAEFAWNMEEYDPDESIWRILIANFGYNNALELILFNDSFVKLLEIYQSPVEKNNFDRLKKIGISTITNLEFHFQSISDAKVFDRELVNELKERKDILVSSFNMKLSKAQEELALQNHLRHNNQ